MTLPCFSSTDKTQHHHWSCQTSQGPEFVDYKNTSGVKGSTKTNLCRPNPPTRHWAHRGYRITMKTYREKPWKNQTFGGYFFPFNLFHKNCSSVHFWWAGQDLVVLSTPERPRHHTFPQFFFLDQPMPFRCPKIVPLHSLDLTAPLDPC